MKEPPQTTYKAVLAYNGSGFHGVALQPGLRTVGAVLEQAVREAAGQDPVSLAFAGRTDAGVHARGQVASFRLTNTIGMDVISLAAALRAALPGDLRLKSLETVPRSFHARSCARTKVYRYRVVVGDEPALQRRAWCVVPQLDVQRMRSLATRLVGTRDFSALRNPRCHANNTVKTLVRIRVGARTLRSGVLYVVVDVEGTGFLRRMVRILVGTLAAHGAGWLLEQDVVEAVARGNRDGVGPEAPAHALTLWRVVY